MPISTDRCLLFVGAHPDDESFGSGGTLAKYALAGARVYYACATRGEVGEASAEHLAGHASTGDMRWSELTCAAAALHLTGVIHQPLLDPGELGLQLGDGTADGAGTDFNKFLFVGQFPERCGDAYFGGHGESVGGGS